VDRRQHPVPDPQHRRDVGVWKSLGGRMTSAPDAVDGMGGVTVFARGTDGRSHFRSLDPKTGKWTPWTQGGLATSSATSTVRASDVFQIQYFRGARHHIYSNIDVAPCDLGFEATSAPDASFSGEVIAARGTDLAVWALVDGHWKSLGGVAR
jgi:hypothetical protein